MINFAKDNYPQRITKSKKVLQNRIYSCEKDCYRDHIEAAEQTQLPTSSLSEAQINHTTLWQNSLSKFSSGRPSDSSVAFDKEW